MSDNEIKRKIGSNLIWRMLERFGAQGVTFVVSIILARLLEPEVYGTVALISVLTSILQVFVESGFGNALIQKKNPDDLDFSTVFYFNITVCVVLYLLLFFFAPLIVQFYDLEDNIISVIRVLGLVVIISGVKSVQQAYVSKNLIFKKFFYSTLGGTLGAAVLGIVMAYNGFGVWALVAQNVFNQTIDMIILWITVKWRPQKVFSVKRLKSLFSYGWKFLFTGLLNTGYNELRAMVIGKKYTKEDLAFYNKGQQFPQFIENNVNFSIDSVLLPVMSDAQDNRDIVKSMCRRSIKIGSFITIPLLFGLAAISTPFVSLLLTDKWLPAVPFLMISCCTGAFYPVQTANLNAIKALGRSDLFLLLEILKKVVGMVAILVSMWFGVLWIAISAILVCFISMIINSFPNRKLLNYSLKEQLADLLPNLVSGTIMFAITYSLRFIGLTAFPTLLLQVVVGVALYVGLSLITKNESFYYCLSIIKLIFKK